MSQLYIRQEIVRVLPQVDALLFDIDGVLLDVSGSFRQAIVETTQYFLKTTLGLEDTGKLIEPHEIELFKFAGGFNDDWELTNAAVALCLAKAAQSGAKDTKALREYGVSWREYTDAIKRKGGGLKQAEIFLLETLGSVERREFARGWNQKLVTRLFQEFYAGDDACKELYDFTPEHVHGEGYYKTEKPLIDISLLPKNFKIGVVTGRSKAETHLALRQLNLANRIKDEARITPELGVKKPDGHTLAMAREALDFKCAIYIGDILDDLNTVLNYREQKGAGKARIISAIALSGPGGDAHQREFLEKGADIIAPDVNFLLQYLGNVLKTH